MMARTVLPGATLGAALLMTLPAPGMGGDSPTGRVDEWLARFRQIDWDARAVGIRKGPLDDAWKTRLTVEHELLAAGQEGVPTLVAACTDANRHVRCLAALCLGLLNDARAVPALSRLAAEDRDPMVRLRAVEALGRLGAGSAVDVVKSVTTNDSSIHVRNAAKWALPRVEAGRGVGASLRKVALKQFDANRLATAVVGRPAPDFTLTRGDGTPLSLHDFRGKRNVVLLFMLADW